MKSQLEMELYQHYFAEGNIKWENMKQSFVF